MSFLYSLIKNNASTLHPTFRTLTAIGHLVMLGASIATILDPVKMAAQIGLPLTRTLLIESASKKSDDPSTHSEKEDSVPNESQVALRSTIGWPLAFADRNLCLALNGLLLNYLGEYKALAVVGQVALIAGLGDAWATWRFGGEGTWKGHLWPTLGMMWLGPVGLVLYWG